MRELKVGEKVVRRHVINPDAMLMFSDMVGDRNPIHHDESAARIAGFKGPIAYGMVAGSLFSEILGNHLPGPGSVYASQTFRFLAPIYVGDEIALTVEVLEVRADQRVVTVRTSCVSSDGRLCMDGEAVLIRRDLGAPE